MDVELALYQLNVLRARNTFYGHMTDHITAVTVLIHK
jgi:hypothetical protein